MKSIWTTEAGNLKERGVTAYKPKRPFDAQYGRSTLDLYQSSDFPAKFRATSSDMLHLPMRSLRSIYLLKPSSTFRKERAAATSKRADNYHSVVVAHTCFVRAKSPGSLSPAESLNMLRLQLYNSPIINSTSYLSFDNPIHPHL